MLTKEKERKDSSTTNSGEIIAFLGKGTSFKGVITYEGTVRIDGNVEGEIITKGALVIGESAEIKAEIEVGTLVCGGAINGNIVAFEKVQLIAPAIVTGTIKTPILIIEEGVRFNGSVDMGKSASHQSVAELRKGE
ncbi:MAG: polymer-forming cytoskeletal protein [Nitrospirae bacterium]|nr:polymer-forming cytoskeletal protein [Nitrospirota bacterium]MBI3594282.1 polymer-forming cytoskeletal protein [Nitrospirota bacterium]